MPDTQAEQPDPNGPRIGIDAMRPQHQTARKRVPEHRGELPTTSLREYAVLGRGAHALRDYLPGVPLDYIDRERIRYSKESLAVWTIGETNLQVTRVGQKAKSKEFIQHLEFASPHADGANTRQAPADRPSAP